MRDKITHQNQVNLSDNYSLPTDQDQQSSFYQFKLLQLQQQNQSLGDQSQSLTQFPSQLQVNQCKNIKDNNHNESKSDNCYFQTENQKNGSTDYSFINNQQTTQYKTFEQNFNFTNYENTEMCNEISKINESISFQNKKNVFAQSIFNQKQNAISQIQASPVIRKNIQHKTINYQSPFNVKETNKIGAKQRGFKKRNNLLDIDKHTQQEVWKKKWLQIIYLISKLKKIAFQSALFFRPQYLREIQIRLINDLSSNQNQQTELSQQYKYKVGSFFTYSNFKGIISFKNYRKILKFIIKYFGFILKTYEKLKIYVKNTGIYLLKYFPLFHNLSSLYILWEAIIFVASTILFVYLPFEYCFGLARGQFFSYYMSYFCTLIFSFDIFIKFNTISAEQGTSIEQHIQIFTNYLSSFFLTDLLSLISLNSQAVGLDGVQFLFFLRIFQPFRIIEIFREQFLLKTRMFGIMSLFYLLAQVMYLAHLFTCLWNYIGLLQLQQNKGWIVYYNFQTESVTSRYIQIFYYAIVTMTTIGYGDFTAQTHLEKFLMIFVAFFSCGIFGYTINSIGNILYDIKQKRDLYLQELAKINKYFKQNNVELGLQCRAKKYIQYLYSDQYCDHSCSIKSLSSLSIYLQKEIQQDVYIKMLKKVLLFREIVNDQIFSELALQMKERIFCHDQIITNQSEEENEIFVYFVNDGTILEYSQYNSLTQIKEIQKFRYGQHFGLIKFMRGDSNGELKYKSVGVSSVLQLSLSNFRDILRKYDIEYQKFCNLKDEVKYQSKFQKINTQCYSCQQKNHTLEECPYLFYEGKKHIILRKYIQECNFQIKNFKRKKQKKSLNAVINVKKVQKSSDLYYQQNISYFSIWDLSQESDSISETDNEDQEEDLSESEEQSSYEYKKQKVDAQFLSDLKASEFKKGSIIEEQAHQLCERKCSFQIQRDIQSQHEGDTNTSNLSNKHIMVSGIIPSKLLQDDGSIILEENQNNQTATKKNLSQKKLKTKDQNQNFSNIQDYEQLNNIISQTRIQTQQKLERCQTQSSQQQKYINKLQNMQIFNNIDLLLHMANHSPLNCSIQNCQTCLQIDHDVQSMIREIMNIERNKLNLTPSMKQELHKMKSVLQTTKQRIGFISNLGNVKTLSFINKNTNSYLQVSKGSSKQLPDLSIQFFNYEFDKMRKYQFYFPDGNYQILQQQNQNLGDQSQSLIQFPSQTLVNQGITFESSNIRNGVNSEIYNIQNQNLKSCVNNSFIYNHESQCLENNSKFTNENNETCCQISKVDQQIPHGDKIQFIQSTFCERQSLFSANQASSMFAKCEKNKAIHFQMDLDSKESNKLELTQRGYKKRNNLLTRDNNASKEVWRKKWLQILALVSKMKKAAQQSSLFFRPQSLREIQIRLINDLSSNQIHQIELSQLDKYNLGSLFTYTNFQGIMSFKNYRKMLKFIKKYFGFLISTYDYLINQTKMIGIHIFKFFPLFHNLSTLYILWEAVNSIASLILFVYLPFEYCFTISRGYFFSYYISYFCTIIFSIDIFVKFNTVSTEQGNPIEQHMQIFTNYFSSSFFIDLISLLSLNYTIFDLNGIYFLFILRIFQPFRTLELFREQFLLKTKIFEVISLIYLLAQVIYFAHLFTCLWNYVGLLELQQNTGWIVAYSYQTESVTVRYIQTFYYAIVTMTTIGYGDFTAQTQLEKLLMIFIAFFSCGIFGYTINSIGNILYDFKQKRDLYLQELAKINKYFKQNNVELGLQCRAKKYIQYLYSDQYSDQSCSIKSLSSLSVYLQKEIQQDVYIKMLKKVPIFREIATEQIFNELALLMKEKITCHDQIISNQEEEEENEYFIYFVNDGTILEYCHYDSKTQINEIQKFKYGQYFGLVQFMSGSSNKLKYKSIGVSSILQLSCSNLRDVLKKYDLEYQKFCRVFDEVKFQNKFQKINSYCFSCLQKNHKMEECPYLFYEGKKSIILRQYLKECDYKIKNFQRKKQEKSLNTLISQAYVQQQADKCFLQNMPCFSMWYESQECESQQERNFSSDQEVGKESKENSSVEKNEYYVDRKVYSEQKLGECSNKGSIIEDQQLQLCGRKFSLLIQNNINNQLDQGEVNSSNLLNVKKIYSNINPSKLSQEDEGSIIIEENLNNQGNKNKKNASQKNFNVKDSGLNILNVQEYDQQGNTFSQTKIYTNQNIEIQQIQSQNTQKQINKYYDVFKHIEFLLSNHSPFYCLNQNCQICYQTENKIQNIFKEMFSSDKNTSNLRSHQYFEPQKMKSVLQSTKQRTAFIQSQNNMKTQNFNNKNANYQQYINKRGSKQLQALVQQPFIYDFDKMRNYQFYFEYGNCQAVLDRYYISQKHKALYQEQKLFVSQHSTKFNQRIN
ncbi:hypothetical protein ABPG72_015852 [Tetrahymena utriculariae]